MLCGILKKKMQLGVKFTNSALLPTGNSMHLPWNYNCLRSVPSGNTMQELVISKFINFIPVTYSMYNLLHILYVSLTYVT